MFSVYVTCANEKEAEKIALATVGDGLAACANYFPCKSVYKWKGKLAEEKEFVLVLKAAERNYKKLEARIRQLHSYEVPCIVATKVARAYKPYEKWVLGRARK
ncbi:MAG: divalent-cation tolerance protein CutA [Candidatus Micrarchaeia archaeon]|jgi:periplasmic divalent cation tolerance protein